MDQSKPAVPLNTSWVVERIFEATTLEAAIFWREVMVDRLNWAIDNLDSSISMDEWSLYAMAKAEMEQAIRRLRECARRGDRLVWPPAKVPPEKPPSGF